METAHVCKLIVQRALLADFAWFWRAGDVCFLDVCCFGLLCFNPVSFRCGLSINTLASG